MYGHKEAVVKMPGVSFCVLSLSGNMWLQFHLHTHIVIPMHNFQFANIWYDFPLSLVGVNKLCCLTK